jgi:excisionase family DNA binding protein
MREEKTHLEATQAPETPLAISQLDRREIEELYVSLTRSQAKLVGPDGETRNLPSSLYSFLVQLVELFARGESVTIIQHHAKLTTVEAATMLGVSRQFLVNLLEKGELPHHKVGSHRRVYAKDLLHYKARRDSARRQAIANLVRAEVEDGTYDEIPPLNADAG